LNLQKAESGKQKLIATFQISTIADGGQRRLLQPAANLQFNSRIF